MKGVIEFVGKSDEKVGVQKRFKCFLLKQQKTAGI